MTWIIDFLDTIMWFILMGFLAIMKEGMGRKTPWEWKTAFVKFLTNIIAGVGFYSFILSYWPWYGENPQRIWVIMIVVYGGNTFIDIVINKIAMFLKGFDMKELIKKLFNL